MTKDEVVAKLGEPTFQAAPSFEIGRTLAWAEFRIAYERWDYRRRRLFRLDFEGLSGPPDSAFVVYFDESGKVAHFHPPMLGQDASSQGIGPGPIRVSPGAPICIRIPGTGPYPPLVIEDDFYGGIGILVSVVESSGSRATQRRYPRVAGVVANYPAHRAGVLPGDILERIDNKSVKGLSSQQISTMLKGQAGSAVTLTVRQDDGPPRQIRMKRETIFPEGFSHVIWHDRGPAGRAGMAAPRMGSPSEANVEELVVPGLSPKPRRRYRPLPAGTKIRIEVEQDAELNGIYIVDEDGAIEFGYAGLIITERTLSDTVEKITTILERRYFARANVTAKIVEGRARPVGTPPTPLPPVPPVDERTEEDPDLVIGSGRLILIQPDIVYQWATYELDEIFFGSWPPNKVRIMYFERTRPASVPEKALLLWRPRDVATYRGTALGKDAGLALVPDTAENRRRILSTPPSHIAAPPRSEWLPKREAANIAASIVAKAPPLPGQLRFQIMPPRRCDCGWQIVVSGPSTIRMHPGDIYIGDNGSIRHVSFWLLPEEEEGE